MSDARRYAVWPEPRSRSRSLKGSRPSVPHGTNFFFLTLTSLWHCDVWFVALLIFFIYEDKLWHSMEQRTIDASIWLVACTTQSTNARQRQHFTGQRYVVNLLFGHLARADPSQPKPNRNHNPRTRGRKIAWSRSNCPSLRGDGKYNLR